MSLRTRLAASVAVLVAVAIGISGWIAVDAAERELVDEVDAFLEDRVERLGSVPLVEEVLRPEGRRRAGFGDRSRRFGFDALSEDDAITQLVTTDGAVFSTGDVVLPVGDDQVREVLERRSATIATLGVDGTDYRVITTPVGRDAVLMVGRDLQEVEGAIDGLARRTVVLGAVGAAAAALIAWLLASRLSGPIGRLTVAAEGVAETQDLSAEIDVRSSDEVGRLAASFNTMLGALHTSRQQQERLVMDASHELRTPLTSLRTNVDVLQRSASLDEDTRDEILSDVSGELDQLTDLVTELVDLATSTRRPDEPAESLDLGEVVATVADRAGRRTGRVVTLELDDPATVTGHRIGIERAVSNLVDNALKFSPPDTSVSIAVSGGTVMVRDLGPGIGAEDRPHVFDRFYRAAATRSEPGSGLGLSIVADVVKAHRGELHIEDPAEGRGVAIGFTLPVGTTPAAG